MTSAASRFSARWPIATRMPSSVRRFPPPASLAAELERAGLRDVRYVLMAGSIISIHVGTVGAGAP